jgi:hypothetical protein
MLLTSTKLLGCGVPDVLASLVATIAVDILALLSSRSESGRRSTLAAIRKPEHYPSMTAKLTMLRRDGGVRLHHQPTTDIDDRLHRPPRHGDQDFTFDTGAFAQLLAWGTGNRLLFHTLRSDEATDDTLHPTAANSLLTVQEAVETDKPSPFVHFISSPLVAMHHASNGGTQRSRAIAVVDADAVRQLVCLS